MAREKAKAKMRATERMFVRGDVVRAPDPFGGHAGRPYIALSDDTHRFADEEAIYAAITTTPRSDAIPITDGYFIAGGLPVDPSYASPWALVTLKHDDVRDQEGTLDEQTTARIGGNAAHYVDP
jgi:mRNA interferase MazF